jgi:predicted amidophosphoribosyltransferase
MRDRHMARLCDVCQAPMARQEETCWRCGSRWTAAGGARTRLRVIPGGAAPAATHDERAVVQARMDMDRWITEGGSVPFEAAAVLGATLDRS